jgi:GTP-binding protein
MTKLLSFRGLDRVPVEEAEAGDIIAVAGLAEATVPDTIGGLELTAPLPAIPVDPPTLAMTFRINDGPLAGREGKKVTSRQIRDRLFREAEGNVAIKVTDSNETEAFEVAGRGELQLGVLIEQMRREGFELQVSRPEVLLREVKGEVQEPYEHITVDIPPEFIGAVSQSLAARRAQLELMTTDADGRSRMEFLIPTRGLVGYRGQLLTETRGTALLHQIGAGYGPWAGEVTHRTSGVLVSDRSGESNAYALFNLQERSEMFIDSGVEVYEGMIIGVNSRPTDMDVNPTKEKKLTNIRTHSHDEALRLTPPPPLTLESAIEFIAADELVEVTPKNLRLRKRALSQHDRRREAGREYDARQREARAAAASDG